MRIRSIKPEFWRSQSISCLSIEDRLLFIGLWSYVDDNGVGLDEVALIAADLFAMDLGEDPRETFARVSRGLSNLFEAGRIVRYAVENRNYLAVTNWSEHQRIDKPNKPRYPDVSAGNAVVRETLASMSRDPRETLAPGAGEQGSRGAGEQGSRGADSSSPAAPSRERDRFDEFWDSYPRKVGKDDARNAYQAARKRVDQQAIIDGCIRLAGDPNLPEKNFIPHPATWLRRGGWQDEPLPPRRDGPRPAQRIATADQRLIDGAALAQRLRAEESQQSRMEIEA